MKTFKLVIVLISLILWIISCLPYHRTRDNTIQKVIRTTGAVIAVDHLLQKYENEHRKFYEEEIGGDDHLKWPAMDNKNLSDYCNEFLQHSVPRKITSDAKGFKIKKVLHYEKENTSVTSNVVLVHCKVWMCRLWSYYVTRSPEKNCVYAVKRNVKGDKFTIIYKYCDLENKYLKWKKKQIILRSMHGPTGQPIANDKYLLTYEKEHQEMFKREEDNGNRLEWPYASLHSNLDYFCWQYMEECAPGRKQKGMKGSLKTQKLFYQKLDTNEVIYVTTVVCALSKYERYYHMTRAPEANCVYALLRKGYNLNCPLCIIFKHCDFENENGQQNISQDNDTIHNNVIPKN